MRTRAKHLVFAASLGVLLAGCTKPNAVPADAAGDDTADADTSVAIDADTSSAIDAAPLPVCPTTTHQCVAASPSADWKGPVIRAIATVPTEPAACGTNFDTEAAAVFDGLNATGTCTCDCSGDTTGTACSDATIRGYFPSPVGQAPCSTPVSGTTETLAPSSTCTASALASNSSVDSVFVTLGTVTTPGTCGETPQVTDGLAAPTWTRAERYCESTAPSAGTCDAGDTCAPQSDAGFGSELCVYQVGVHECVAESVYSERFVRHQSFTDQRSCGACACNGPTVGDTCPGAVRFGQTIASCNNGPISTGGCIDDPFGGADDGARYTQVTSIGCSASGGGVVGAATEAMAVTFCCEAEVE